METRILVFYVVIFAGLALLALYPRSVVVQIALLWIGPKPIFGESWAQYQFRWGIYSLVWLGQIVVLFLILLGVAYVYPIIENHEAFLILTGLALPIGAGMAVLAAFSFFVKAAKAKYFGPNPIFVDEGKSL